MAKGSTWTHLNEYLNHHGITYSQYLKSEHWQELKARFKKSRLCKGKCYACGRSDRRIDIHHKTYRRIGRERLNDLVEMCGDCHKAAHELEHSKNARRFRLSQVHKRLKRSLMQ